FDRAHEFEDVDDNTESLILRRYVMHGEHSGQHPMRRRPAPPKRSPSLTGSISPLPSPVQERRGVVPRHEECIECTEADRAVTPHRSEDCPFKRKIVTSE